jgi:hypothetical protein
MRKTLATALVIASFWAVVARAQGVEYFVSGTFDGPATILPGSYNIIDPTATSFAEIPFPGGVVTAADISSAWEARSKALGDRKPASTLIVGGLANPA